MKIVLNNWFAEKATSVLNRFHRATMKAKREEGNTVKLMDVREHEHEDEIITETQYNVQSQLEWQMLLIYPFSVLATNKALDTIISRKPLHKQSLFFDLLDTWRVGKFKALYAGLIPTVIFTFLFTGTVYKTSRVH